MLFYNSWSFQSFQLERLVDHNHFFSKKPFFWGHNALFVCAFFVMGAISLLDVGPLYKREVT